jgi:hypothetical protein
MSIIEKGVTTDVVDTGPHWEKRIHKEKNLTSKIYCDAVPIVSQKSIWMDSAFNPAKPPSA